nr:MAG TPA: hypoxia-inducible factor-1 [Caudoviricetes sp.]
MSLYTKEVSNVNIKKLAPYIPIAKARGFTRRL